MNLNRLRFPYYHVASLSPFLPNALIPVAGGGGLESILPRWGVGKIKNFVTPHIAVLAAGTVGAPTTNTVYAYPFLLGSPAYINCCQARFGNTAASVSNVFISIYDNTSTVTEAAWPRNRVVQFSRIQPHLFASNLRGATSPSPPTFLDVGIYWLVVHNQANTCNINRNASGAAPVSYRTSALTFMSGVSFLQNSSYSLPTPFPFYQYTYNLNANFHRIELLFMGPDYV
jgi:hypothetical protein